MTNNTAAKTQDTKTAKLEAAARDYVAYMNGVQEDAPTAIKTLLHSDTLALRDAILIATLIDEFDIPFIADLAVNPKETRNKVVTAVTLEYVFEHPSYKPDHEHIARALRLFHRHMDDEGDTSITDGIIAYLAWFAGDAELARGFAEQALDTANTGHGIGGSMANIILTAVQFDVRPAWLDKDAMSA